MMLIMEPRLIGSDLGDHEAESLVTMLSDASNTVAMPAADGNSRWQQQRRKQGY